MVFNPLAQLESKVDSLRKQLRHDIHVDLLREATITGLSRLLTLDPENAPKYQSAIDSMG